MRTRTRTWAVTAATAAALLAVATPSSAAGGGGTPWSVAHGAAKAEGERRLARNANGVLQLHVEGKLTHTGEGCSSVWAQFQFDMVPVPARKQVQVCGDGTVDVSVRATYMPTTTARLTVCRGTEDTTDCAQWASVTHWAVG